MARGDIFKKYISATAPLFSALCAPALLYKYVLVSVNHICYCRSPLEKTRYETSLGLLTKKFVSLFHSDPSGTVDLNRASTGKYRYLPGQWPYPTLGILLHFILRSFYVGTL